MSELRLEESREQEDALPTRLGLGALFADSAVYGGTRVLIKSLSFLLVPLYAHFLATSEFGVLELVLATMAFIDVFINLPGTLARFYFERDDPAWRREVISVYLTLEATYPAVLIGGLIAFSGFLSEGVVGTAGYAGFFVIALCDLYLTNIVDLPMALCRLRRKPLTFSAYSLTRALTQILFAILLVAVFHLGVQGILIASLTSAGVAFVVTLREYRHDLTRRMHWETVRELLSFSWPTLIGALSFYALNFLDRFFIRHYHGLGDNGLYGAAFRYSQVVAVGVVAFRLGWPQWHYSWLRTGRHPQMLARGANYALLGIGFLAVVVSLWILPAFHVVMPERYWDATAAVPPLALGAVASAAYTVFVAGFNVTKRMRLLIPLTLGGAAFAIGLYFLLVPPYSFVGAAWATTAALAALSLATLVVGQRVYPVPWDARRLLLVLAFTVGLAVAALVLDDRMGLVPSLPVRAGLTLAYPFGLAAFGFLTPSDRAAVRRALRRGH